MCLAADKDKVDQPTGGIADAHDLAGKSAAGTAESLLVLVVIAIESQTQCIGLLGRAPAAF